MTWNQKPGMYTCVRHAGSSIPMRSPSIRRQQQKSRATAVIFQFQSNKSTSFIHTKTLDAQRHQHAHVKRRARGAVVWALGWSLRKLHSFGDTADFSTIINDLRDCVWRARKYNFHTEPLTLLHTWLWTIDTLAYTFLQSLFPPELFGPNIQPLSFPG
jgi:hypothetical protein